MGQVGISETLRSDFFSLVKKKYNFKSSHLSEMKLPSKSEAFVFIFVITTLLVTGLIAILESNTFEVGTGLTK